MKASEIYVFPGYHKGMKAAIATNATTGTGEHLVCVGKLMCFRVKSYKVVLPGKEFIVLGAF